MTEQEQEAPRGGCISTGLLMFAGICGLITVVSVFNVAFDLEWAVGVSGSFADLPTEWMSVIALALVSLITWGISAIMTSRWVGKQFKTHPWLKWATPIVITLAFVIGFYALYYSIEYAGPLHYAARANDIETVKEELQEGVDEDDFHRSVWECIKLDHAEILKLLLEHPNAEKDMKWDFSYALDIGSMDVLILFIDAGVGSEGEDGDFLAQFLAQSELSKEEKEKVGLKLFEAGANPDGLYTGGYMGTELTALEQAREQGLTKLVTAMETH
ncbi:MAG: hypothetical protein ACI8ZM_004762 [Crocinitomix sp.]|jgi:hypothetical protein